MSKNSKSQGKKSGRIEEINVLKALLRVQSVFGGSIWANQQNDEGTQYFTSLQFLLREITPTLHLNGLILTSGHSDGELVTRLVHVETGEYLQDSRRPMLGQGQVVMGADLVEAESRTRKQAILAILAVHTDPVDRMGDPHGSLGSGDAADDAKTAASSAAMADRPSTATLKKNLPNLVAQATVSAARGRELVDCYIKMHAKGDAAYASYLGSIYNAAVKGAGYPDGVCSYGNGADDGSTTQPSVTIEGEVLDDQLPVATEAVAAALGEN